MWFFLIIVQMLINNSAYPTILRCISYCINIFEVSCRNTWMEVYRTEIKSWMTQGEFTFRTAANSHRLSTTVITRKHVYLCLFAFCVPPHCRLSVFLPVVAYSFFLRTPWWWGGFSAALKNSCSSLIRGAPIPHSCHFSSVSEKFYFQRWIRLCTEEQPVTQVKLLILRC